MVKFLDVKLVPGTLVSLNFREAGSSFIFGFEEGVIVSFTIVFSFTFLSGVAVIVLLPSPVNVPIVTEYVSSVPSPGGGGHPIISAETNIDITTDVIQITFFFILASIKLIFAEYFSNCQYSTPK